MTWPNVFTICIHRAFTRGGGVSPSVGARYVCISPTDPRTDGHNRRRTIDTMANLVAVKDIRTGEWWMGYVIAGSMNRNDGTLSVGFLGTTEIWTGVELSDATYGKTWCNPVNDATKDEPVGVGEIITLCVPGGPAEIDREDWPLPLFPLGHDVPFQVSAPCLL